MKPLNFFEKLFPNEHPHSIQISLFLPSSSFSFFSLYVLQKISFTFNFHALLTLIFSEEGVNFKSEQDRGKRILSSTSN